MRTIKPHNEEPLPYSFENGHVWDRNNLPISEGLFTKKTGTFVVVACNSYADLVAACSRIVSRIPIGGTAADVLLEDDDLNLVRAALAHAKGGAQ